MSLRSHENMTAPKDAYALKTRALDALESAVIALLDCAETLDPDTQFSLYNTSIEHDGARYLDALARRVSALHTELRQRCTTCGTKPSEDGSCVCCA